MAQAPHFQVQRGANPTSMRDQKTAEWFSVSTQCLPQACGARIDLGPVGNLGRDPLEGRPEGIDVGLDPPAGDGPGLVVRHAGDRELIQADLEGKG